MGFDYCSDGRALGSEGVPHYPVVNGEIINCPQLPTTLPTLDELIGLDGVTDANAHEKLLALSEQNMNAWNTAPILGFQAVPQVFTGHAELEGLRFHSVMERLIEGWKDQGYEICATEKISQQLPRNHLPYFTNVQGELPGRSGTLLLQGKEFLPASA
jgi:undecaprenyl phosphate-alpha-L-ara4FN deformylase